MTTMTEDMRELMRALRRTYLLDDPTMTEIWLIRHADAYEQSFPPDGAFDPGLSPLGQDQAELLGGRLAACGVRAVYTSNARRALETAAPACRLLGVEPFVIHGLREMRLIPGEGAEMLADVLGVLRAARERAVSGEVSTAAWQAETHEAAARRMALVLDELVGRHPGQRIAVISHGATINAYVSGLLGIGGRLRIYPEYTGVSIIRARHGQRSVSCINDTSHLHALAWPPSDGRRSEASRGTPLRTI